MKFTNLDIFLGLCPFLYSIFMNVFWAQNQEILFYTLTVLFFVSQALLIYRVFKIQKYSNAQTQLNIEWQQEQRRQKMLEDLRKK